jgi:hypothetical protein
MNRPLRCAASIFVIGVVPLLFANFVGVQLAGNSYVHRFARFWGREHDVLALADSGRERPGVWMHGWPLTLVIRNGEHYTSFYSGPRHNYSDVAVAHTSQPSQGTSRWPFDGAMWFRCWESPSVGLANPLVVNACAWVLLLVGSGFAAERSRFVRTGRMQVSLRTVVLGVTVAGVYFAAFANGFFPWEHVVLLPLLVSALLGYASRLGGIALRCNSRVASFH